MCKVIINFKKAISDFPQNSHHKYMTLCWVHWLTPGHWWGTHSSSSKGVFMGTFGYLLLADCQEVVLPLTCSGQIVPFNWLGAKVGGEALCSQAWSYSHNSKTRAKAEGAMTAPCLLKKPRKWSGAGYLSSGNRQQGVHDRQHFADVHVCQLAFLRQQQKAARILITGRTQMSHDTPCQEGIFKLSTSKENPASFSVSSMACEGFESEQVRFQWGLCHCPSTSPYVSTGP